MKENALSRETLWFCLHELVYLVEAAIESGDWKVDGAADPDMALRFSRRALGLEPKNEP